MTPEELAASVAGAREGFEAALSPLSALGFSDVIARAFPAISASDAISDSEKERRVQTILVRLPPQTPSDFQALAAFGASATPSIRNALLRILPPEHRRQLFSRDLQSAEPKPSSEIALAESTATSNANLPEAAEAGAQDYADVIVLSLDHDPATNKLLEEAGLVPLRCATVEQLQEHLTNNVSICAFLVEASFLRAYPSEHATIISEIAAYSTFTYIRIDSSNLAVDDGETFDLVRRARCSVPMPAVDTLSIKDRSGIQQRDIPHIVNARNRLANVSGGGLFVPSEFTESEFRLLGAAIRRYADQRRYNPRAQLSSARTAFMQGGMSEARVILVRLDYLKYPVIAKLHSKAFILEEARRFFAFIAENDHDLHPEVYLHAQSAAIIFDAIPGIGVTNVEPAPTLAALLSNRWYKEMRREIVPADDDSIIRGVRNAADRLAGLNSRRCPDSSFRTLANPFLESLIKMEAAGFSWGFTDDALARREAAQEKLRANEHVAVCHGDAHTRNILVRGDQGYLIDYAYSGPGHPCADLARLELSIFLTVFHPFGSDGELRALQRDLSTEGLDLERIVAAHPSLFRSSTNRLCAKLCVEVRNRVRSVLTAHNLGWESYVALKLLSAWQALMVPTVQQSLVRAVIAALSEPLS